MVRIVFAFLFAAAAHGQDASERLAELLEAEWAYTMQSFPTFATHTGYPGYDDRWTDFSPEAIAERHAHRRALLADIDAILRDELPEHERLTYDLFRYEAAEAVKALRFPGHYLLITQLGGPQTEIAETIENMSADSVADYETIVARLANGVVYIRQVTALLREGLATGVTPPRIALRAVPEQAARMIEDAHPDHPLLAPFKDMPEAIGAAEQERLRTEAAAALRDGLIPAYRELHAFLVDEYLPGAREDIAFSNLPDGAAWYENRIRAMTTTAMTAQEIHDLGLAEVARIRAEMEAIVETTGFDGDLMAFFDFVRSDPQFFFDDKEALLAAYRDICKRADPELMRLFGKLPRTPYGVRAIPAYVEQSHATAYYQPGAPAAGRPGYFCANTYALHTRPKWEMEALALHEAVPGHHLQISLAQEMEDVPEFRRFGHYTAYTEGWGLYAESLGAEMGFYADPYSKFGQLTYEMWRAVRLVVDTGMHALGWSRQQAIDYFMANAGKAEHDIIVEIDRYIVWPGQALAYKIGELKMKELRKRAETALGDGFDIRAFHDALLADGALPLPILEARIDAWIDARRPAHASGHPRLYGTAADWAALRATRGEPVRDAIWRNIAESAEWCLTKTPRTEWIAPIADDPVYENLYDRFYAMMMDMAITEHLAFAYALSGDARYGEAARAWTLACCRAWAPDAEAEPDGGKAYAVMRLLKGAAVGYDLAYDRFSEDERAEIRTMLAATAGNYFDQYFSQPSHAGPGFHTHHAVVEYSSFGVAALALLGEAPDAQRWLDATVAKFEDHLLPTGLASDGAQVEGATFWASTMHYRLFFMDALRRVTGRDLFASYAEFMNADLALASVAARHTPGWSEPHQSVVLSPSYGQLDYYAPALLGLAREYGNPLHQRLALWDDTLGAIQQTRYITPNRREQLLFELGGYAYLWYDPAVPIDAPDDAPLSFAFPSVRQAYARGSWEPGGLLAAMDAGGQLVIHAGGLPILIASGLSNESEAAPALEDDGVRATLVWAEGDERRVVVTLERPGRITVAWQGLPAEWSFWSVRVPRFDNGALAWEGGAALSASRGAIERVEEDGYAPAHAVGNGKLALIDPEPRRYPLVHLRPDSSGGAEVTVTGP